MAWTAPRTWTTGELVTAAIMNTHVRDNLSAGFPTDAVWTTWSPSYNAAVTVGNGTATARYVQVGTLVMAEWSLLLGSTSAIGVAPTISLPVTANAGVSDWHGWGRILDAGTAEFKAIVSFNSTTVMKPLVETASGTYVGVSDLTSTTPMTWATNDILRLTVIYEAV